MEEALRGGSAPGAFPEGTLSTTQGGATILSAEAATACWYVETSRSRGLWPYHREMVMGTYWCAAFGSHIMYRSTNVVGRTNGVCWERGTDTWKISGGVWGNYAIEESGG